MIRIKSHTSRISCTTPSLMPFMMILMFSLLIYMKLMTCSLSKVDIIKFEFAYLCDMFSNGYSVCDDNFMHMFDINFM